MGKKRHSLDKHKQGLGDELEDPATHGVKIRTGRAAKRQRQREEKETLEQQDARLLSSDLTGKILEQARQQREELDAEDNGQNTTVFAQKQRAKQPARAAVLHEDSDSDSDLGGDLGNADDFTAWENDMAEVSAEDELALAAFMTPLGQPAAPRTLADIIMEKIKDKQQRAVLVPVDRAPPPPPELDPKVIEVYRAVGEILSRYTSGKVPKALKIIPSLSNWEEVLYLTEPENWTPHAYYEATKLFVSNLNQKMAQRFLNLVLLPAVRNDIQEHKRLHFALFQALKKSIYKPAAFYKGILLPLCASGDCTVREAVIVSSVIKRTAVPVLHSAAALLRLAEMPYNGINSFFMRVLLDKKYALPYRVVDALVDHFTGFQHEERQLPVVWHAALLCFVQRYKHEIRKEDKVALRTLCRAQHHYKITPEVLRELDLSRDRGQKASGTAQPASVPKLDFQVKEDMTALPQVVLMEEY